MAEEIPENELEILIMESIFHEEKKYRESEKDRRKPLKDTSDLRCDLQKAEVD